MNAAKLWLDNSTHQEEIDYLTAYRYGLRRHYHGQRFGSEKETSAFSGHSEASTAGLHDGLSGKMCDFRRLEEYAAT